MSATLVGLDGAPLTAASFVQAPVVERSRVFTRTPDPAWVATLAQLTPRSDTHSWLHLAWEPGDPWAGHTIERWVLWTMRPPAMIDPARRKELDGPAPRSTGHYCGPSSLCGHDPRRRPDQWVGGACGLIDQGEWELYQRTGAYGTRWWVIEGAAGGHLYRYNAAQAMLARTAGLPDAPPVPGSEDYAEPDARTWDAVREHDVFTKLSGRLLERDTAEMDAADRDEAVGVRRSILAWFRRQAREAIEIGGRAWQQDLAANRPASHLIDPDPDYDAEDEAFVHDLD